MRRESFSRQIADNIAKLLPADIEAVRIDLDMPIYNQDADDDGYRSPDARLVFSMRDGELVYRMTETFTLTEALFTKLKNIGLN